jgi:hypothetical protein
MKKLEKPQGAYSKKNQEKLKLYLEKKNDTKPINKDAKGPTEPTQSN